ncbi:MAG: hypothetical protein LBB89_13145 [Treponema sp.]|jgi:hypothetical protein|nr:hypothetical protein [Treponema sp.]
MIKNKTILLLPIIIFFACVTKKEPVLFIPDPVQNKLQEQAGLSESWEIINSQNGSPEKEIPAWLRAYLDRGVQGIESLDAYSGKYVFVGENRGNTINVLQQWADGFTTAQDMPRLIVQRVEKRLVASASLYPDDEYGEYFASLIKKVSDGEYPGADKEQTFWIKQKKIPGSVENENAETPPVNDDIERYEFFVLITINKEALQKMIQKIMADIKTNTAPTRQQRTAISAINQTFFEGF